MDRSNHAAKELEIDFVLTNEQGTGGTGKNTKT